MLSVEGLTRTFAGVKAVDGVTFSVAEGSITALIGPNGAGKTTTLNLISGGLAPTSGSIRCQGTDLTRQGPMAATRMGIMRTFQNGGLFEALGLTVRDNLMIGGHRNLNSGFLATALRLPGGRREETALRQRVEEVLSDLELADVADVPVGTLSFGQRRLVETGRALVSRPRLLLLDEPAAGLNDAEREAFAELLRKINRQGTTLLLVEHHMDLVFGVAHWIVVLNYGVKLTEGPPELIAQDPQVISAYLG